MPGMKKLRPPVAGTFAAGGVKIPCKITGHSADLRLTTRADLEAEAEAAGKVVRLVPGPGMDVYEIVDPGPGP